METLGDDERNNLKTLATETVEREAVEFAFINFRSKDEIVDMLRKYTQVMKVIDLCFNVYKYNQED